MPQPHPSPASAIGAEMARMALLCRRALVLQRLAGLPVSGHAHDAAQAERELTRLEHPPGRAPQIVDDGLTRLEERLAQRERRNAQDRAATTPEPPIYDFQRRAGLSRSAFDLFLLALMPEMDEGFGRFFQLLSAGKRRALDVATAARVLTPDDVGAGEVRRLLSPGQPLSELGLLELTQPEGGRQPGVATMGTVLVVPPPVIAYVLGQQVHDAGLRLIVRSGTDREARSAAVINRDARNAAVINRDARSAAVMAQGSALPRARTFLPDELFARAAALLQDRAAVPYLEGLAGAGKRRLMRTLCAEQGRPLLEVDVARAGATAGAGLSSEEALAVVRLGWLLGAVVLLSLPSPEAEGRGGWQRGVLEVLGRGHLLPAVVLVRDRRDGGPARLDLPLPPGRRLSPIEVRPPDRDAREGLWRDRLADSGGLTGGAPRSSIDHARLARTYPVTGGVIGRIALEALARARARDSQAPQVTETDILMSVEAEFRPQMETVGRRLALKARMDDLVLPAETRETLAELEATVRLRHQVLDEWGFGRLLRGRGISALFYGDPGTGKTLAAGVISASAGLPLYQIDTAQVVSKWIGETEKNLRDVFRAAEAGHAMLLFDEADAMFGKRTDVNTSNDRYANLQTNFLLSEIELFNGVVILTTNRESVMDMAFQRRLTFRVHFPLPEEAEREELWRRMLSGQEVAMGEVSYGELARRLRMSGGYIRNAVLRGAYLAAAAGVTLDTQLLRHAAELVLRDAGKVI